jgi:glycosyltransferase involved in cell wall biosynthesis
MQNPRRPTVGHIIHSYKPLLGGAEVYVAELIRAIDEADHVVFQKDSGDRSPEVRPVKPWPRPFKSFKTALRVQYRRELAGQDLLVFHDLLNVIPPFAGRGIGVCHGVNWKNPGQSDRKTARMIGRTRDAWANCLGLVANDTDFFREMGIADLSPGDRAFEEVEPFRWFIPNCVDTDRFSPGTPIDAIRRMNAILVPRRVVPARGIDLAVQAFRHLHAERPDLTLLIAGDVGDTRYMERLQALIAESGLIGAVFFTGRIPNDRMALVYRSASLCLIPTLYSEGTSLSALESMACGCPTFSTAIGGLLDLPTVKVPTDPERMAGELFAALPSLDRLGREQTAAVRSGFNRDRWAAAWRTVINRCLEKRGIRPPSA